MKVIGMGWKKIIGVGVIVVVVLAIVAAVNRKREEEGKAPILR